MHQVARLGDAIDHGGEIVTASPNVFANSIQVARLSDRVHCVIHGDQTIVTASTTVFANDLGVARIGDLVSCGAVIVTGSPNVFAGG